MSPRLLVLVFALVAGVGWWLLRESPEEQVRAAHQQLRELVSKTPEDGATPAIRDVLAWQAMFADQVDISGDTEGLARNYSAEDTVSLIVQVRAAFQTIDVTFGELSIGFPTDDVAVADFSAVLRVTRGSAAGDELTETRAVTSRMQQVDGDWVFAAFEFRSRGSD